MSTLLKIVAATSAAVLVGGLAYANADRGVETQAVARHDSSVLLAVAPPHPTEIKENPAVNLPPSLPSTPPLPRRMPKIPTIDMAGAADDSTAGELKEAMERAVISEPTTVRSGPSEDAPMLYAFPAGRELRVVADEDGFTQIEDVRSGADGWVKKSALASDIMTASVDRTPRVRQAKAEIKTPKPVTGIPEKERYSPMLLGGSETAAARPAGPRTNFASFVRRGFGAN
jgi:Bacterial SH3 domain